MISKGPKSICISMGGLRFAAPPVKAESKRETAKKKVVLAGDAVAVPVAAEAVPQVEIAVPQPAVVAEEPGDQARAA